MIATATDTVVARVKVGEWGPLGWPSPLHPVYVRACPLGQGYWKNHAGALASSVSHPGRPDVLSDRTAGDLGYAGSVAMPV